MELRAPLSPVTKSKWSARSAFISFSFLLVAGVAVAVAVAMGWGVGGGGGWQCWDRSLILSPFVSRAGVRAGASASFPLSLALSSLERGPPPPEGGQGVAFLSVWMPAFRRASSFPGPR